MTEQEFHATDWQHHDIAQLTNGKLYVVQAKRKKRILLYSTEFKTYFTALPNIIVCRRYKVQDSYATVLESSTLSPEIRETIRAYEMGKVQR